MPAIRRSFLPYACILIAGLLRAMVVMVVPKYALTFLLCTEDNNNKSLKN